MPHKENGSGKMGYSKICKSFGRIFYETMET
jgi:hypothetical protein